MKNILIQIFKNTLNRRRPGTLCQMTPLTVGFVGDKTSWISTTWVRLLRYEEIQDKKYYDQFHRPKTWQAANNDCPCQQCLEDRNILLAVKIHHFCAYTYVWKNHVGSYEQDHFFLNSCCAGYSKLSVKQVVLNGVVLNWLKHFENVLSIIAWSIIVNASEISAFLNK